MVTLEEMKDILDREGDKHVPVKTAVEKYIPVSLSTLYRMIDEETIKFILVGRKRGKWVSLRSIYEHLTRPVES